MKLVTLHIHPGIAITLKASNKDAPVVEKVAKNNGIKVDVKDDDDLHITVPV